MFKNLITWWTESKKIRTTEKELYRLSDKELSDIGIHRSMIPSIARDCAESNDNIKGWV